MVKKQLWLPGKDKKKYDKNSKIETPYDKKNQKLIIHTNSKSITLKYMVAPWIIDSENFPDTDTLYLFSEESNITYRGYRYKDSIDYNHLYDPLNIRSYRQLKIPAHLWQ